MQPTPVARRWSTDAVEPPQRLDYWVGAICEGFLEMDATSSVSRSFAAELQSMPLEAVTVHQVLGSPQDVYRRASAIARSRVDYYYLLWKSGTPCAVEQDERTTRLQAGDLALIDSRRCYALHFPDTVDVLSLQLPIGWLETWVADPAALVATRIDGSRGWGQVLGSFVRQLQPALLPGAVLPARVMAEQLGGLLALAAEAPPAPSNETDQQRLYQRVDEWIRAESHRPGLCAADAAQALGLSVRTLYRCLAAGHATFAERLLHHRLAAARRMLASRHFGALTLAEIGRRAGWPDASHFTRVCRRWLGDTPQQLRCRSAFRRDAQ